MQKIGLSFVFAGNLGTSSPTWCHNHASLHQTKLVSLAAAVLAFPSSPSGALRSSVQQPPPGFVTAIRKRIGERILRQMLSIGCWFEVLKTRYWSSFRARLSVKGTGWKWTQHACFWLLGEWSTRGDHGNSRQGSKLSRCEITLLYRRATVRSHLHRWNVDYLVSGRR